MRKFIGRYQNLLILNCVYVTILFCLAKKTRMLQYIARKLVVVTSCTLYAFTYIFIGVLILHLGAMKNRGTLYLVVWRTLVFSTRVFYCLSKYTIVHYSNDQRTRSIIMACILLLFMHLQHVLVFTNAKRIIFLTKNILIFIDFYLVVILNNFHIKKIIYPASNCYIWY